MRRVHLKHGLKQRINELVGEDATTTTDGVPDITTWSVQAAMLENVRRVGYAIAGNSFGRVMSGLDLTCDNTTLSISIGEGITPNGDVVMVGAELVLDVSSLPNDVPHHVYLKRVMGVVDSALYPIEGKTTAFIGRQGVENIVYDDVASTLKFDVGRIDPSLIIDVITTKPATVNSVWLGSFIKHSSDPAEVSSSPDVGLSKMLSGVDLKLNSRGSGILLRADDTGLLYRLSISSGVLTTEIVSE